MAYTGSSTLLGAASVNGFTVQTSAHSFTTRAIISTTANLGVTNADGVAGNPTLTLSLSSNDVVKALNYTPVRSVAGQTNDVVLTINDIQGLGSAAALYVGAIAGTVASGNDARITGAAQKFNNLSDLANIALAKTNLGLATVASTGSYNDLIDVPSLSNLASLDSPTFTGNPVVPGYLSTTSAATLYAPLTSPTFTGSIALKGVTSISGVLTINDSMSIIGANQGLHIGATTTPNVPYIDFNSSGKIDREYDARVFVNGGSNLIDGQATVTWLAGTFNVTANNITLNGTVIIPSGALIADYAPLASPIFTGVPVVPGYLTTIAASNTYATLVSPIFTGVPVVPGYLTTTNAAGTYAPLNSPALSGIPTAPTPAFGSNTTQIATMAAVAAAVAALIGNAPPAALTTLNNLSVALNNNGDIATSVTTSLADKLSITANLSDVSNTALARTHLGLGNSAIRNIGNTAGTVAAGNDPRMIGALQKSANLADLTNPTAACVNLGLSPVATSGAFSDLIGAPSLTTFAPLASPVFTGAPIVPGYLTSITAANTYATLVSPTFTGTVTIPSGALINGYLTIASAVSTYATKVNPVFSGTPTAPTAPLGTNTTQLATTAFVQNTLLNNNEVSSFNNRVGDVVLTLDDIVNALAYTPYDVNNLSNYQTLDEVNASFVSALPITSGLYGGTNIAGVACGITVSSGLSLIGTSLTVHYGTTNNTVAAGDDHRITGAAQRSSDLADLSNIVAARNNLGLSIVAATGDYHNLINLPDLEEYSPIDSPTFTGTVIIPPGAKIDGYLTGASAFNTYAPLVSPTLIGIPLAPTALLGTNNKQIATTEFVVDAITNNVVPLQEASTTTLGGVKVDGSSITINNGVISGREIGTVSGSVAAGNDQRIVDAAAGRVGVNTIWDSGNLNFGAGLLLTSGTLTTVESDRYKFEQIIPSTIWNVNHNLNRWPSVCILTPLGDLVEGDVNYVDANNITLSFSVDFAGTAYFI